MKQQVGFPQGPEMRGNYILSIAVIGLFFFIFGFVTWLNGILIPYLKIACELSNFQALFVAFAFYISYTLMALPSSWVLKKTGFRNGMMIGLWVMALGTLIFIPAALLRTYAIFLLGLFVLGTGLAILQTASNPYITILGPRETAARRISIMGICNKLAGAIAPLILAYFILHDGDSFLKNLDALNADARLAALDGLARRVIGPYLVMTFVLFALGLFIRKAPLPDIETEPQTETSPSISSVKTSIFQFPHLILGVITLFFYVGIEVIAGDTIIRYGLSIGVPLESAKNFTSVVLIAMVIGYVLGIILIPRVISQNKALAWCGLLGILFTIMITLIPVNTRMTIPFLDFMTLNSVKIVLPYTCLFVGFLGLANALVWPAVWPLAIHDLGRFIKTGSALLIMGIAGGAILPLVWGYLSDIWSPQQAYWLGVPCYLFIIYFALWGHKVKSWKIQPL
ncbi:MAG: sugar MFS transporter [Bacteroidales bacterium]|jgi:glucose/galactose transporter|nr:sugar MFS transporter [Bacteroidales bacterium]